MLLDGTSMRSISRHADVSINTVAKLINDVGAAAKTYHDEHVRRIAGRRRIECSRTWAFGYRTGERGEAVSPAGGNAWTFAGIDIDSRLIVSCLVGDGSRATADALIGDVRRRLDRDPELSTKRLRGLRADRDASGEFVRADPTPRMPANSQKRRLEKHVAIVNLYALHYNFCRVHPDLAVTPAMRAGLDGVVRDAAWIVDLVDARATKPNRPKSYRKRVFNSN